LASDLHCDASKCVYNIQQRCSASRIQVKGMEAGQADVIFCATFAPRKISNMLGMIGNINLLGSLGELISKAPSLKPEVVCSITSCLKNNGGACVTEDLIIGGIASIHAGETSCQSFIAR